MGCHYYSERWARHINIYIYEALMFTNATHDAWKSADQPFLIQEGIGKLERGTAPRELEYIHMSSELVVRYRQPSNSHWFQQRRAPSSYYMHAGSSHPPLRILPQPLASQKCESVPRRWFRGRAGRTSGGHCRRDGYPAEALRGCGRRCGFTKFALS